jgi:hypothetical protein
MVLELQIWQIHETRWFYVIRIVGLVLLLVYIISLLLTSAPVLLSQSSLGQVQRELADHDARLRAGEEFRRDVVAMQLSTRLAVVERTVAEAREEIAWIGKLVFATLITVVGWLLKELFSLMQSRVDRKRK